MENNFNKFFLINLKKFAISFLSFIFPSRLIATFFGIGYLPDWQSHWTAFFSIPLVCIIVHFTVGFGSSVFAISYTIFLCSIALLLVGLLGIYVFQKTVFSENRYEVTIHVAFGQLLMISISTPAILQITNKIFTFNTAVCERFMHCADWFLYLATYLGAALLPYFIFRIVDILKPWPSYFIERDYHNPLSNMSEGFFNAVYATCFAYALAFVLFDLNLVTVIEFYRDLLRYATTSSAIDLI